MRRHALPLTLLTTVALASPAAAKEIRSASVCGASGCQAIASETTRHRLEEGGEIASGPSRTAPYYVLRLEVGGDGHYEKVRAYYVPSTRLIGFQSDDSPPNWGQLTRYSADAYDDVTRGLEPYSGRGLAEFVEQPPAARIVGEYTAPAPQDDGFPWLAMSLGIAGAAGLAVLALARRRRRLAGH